MHVVSKPLLSMSLSISVVHISV